MSRRTTIGELLDETGGSIKTGPFGTKLKAAEYTATGAPVISVGEVGFGRLRVHENTPRVDESVTSRMPEFLLRAGDIVFGRKGAVERSAQVQPHEGGYFLGSDGIRIRLNDKVCDPRFISYQLLTNAHRNWMIQNAGGTTMPSLNEGIIRRIPIILKSLIEQKAIASILGSLDDKIELNNQMNATLEAMARSLFKSWFVDFDPVRAKMDGRELLGHDNAIGALFPATFQNSELGQIPVGWDVMSADKISTVGIGKTPPRKEHHWFTLNPADVPWISIRDLGNAGVFISNTSEFLTSQAVKNFRVRRIPDNTVVLSFKLTMGRVAITDGEMVSNEAIAHFRLNHSLPFGSAYLYCYLKGFQYDQLGSTSSIATAINSNMVREIKILVPTKGIGDIFEETVAPLFSQIKTLQKQSISLAALRDELIPVLLSGKLKPKLLSSNESKR